uniref:Protein amnionless n=1 Tax=Acrobeloides nanus TaxID=290746 RepID=A0A914C163_9BILA
MLTIEGQYIFQLGPERRVDANLDGIEYRGPREKAVQIDEIPYNKAGNRNWNSKNEVLKDLCDFYSCSLYADKYCTNKIRPDGHCCHTCVARMEFRQHSLNFAEAKQVLEQVEKGLIYHTDMGIRLTRLDENEAFPLYQLVVFSEEPENYDESLFYSALNSAFWMIQWRMQQLLNAQPHYTTPKIEYSYQRGKIRASMVFIFLAVLLILGSGSYFVFRYEYQHNYRFRIWFDNSETINQMSVVWQQARNYAEERVEVLLNHGIEEEVPTSFAPEVTF